jgi:hypothetical protein
MDVIASGIIYVPDAYSYNIGMKIPDVFLYILLTVFRKTQIKKFYFVLSAVLKACGYTDQSERDYRPGMPEPVGVDKQDLCHY